VLLWWFSESLFLHGYHSTTTLVSASKPTTLFLRRELKMRQVIATLKSAAPYSQGRYVTEDRGDRSFEQFENDTWKQRLHVNTNGNIYIPAGAFKNSLAEAAKYRPKKLKGNSTFTKHVVAGVLCCEDLDLNITPEQVDKLTLFVPSDGRRGGSTRVIKHFPTIREWSGKVTFIVVDDVIDEQTFEDTLRDAGRFIGLGVSRPINNGSFGRFEIVDTKWSEIK
jgi:hypothetical protein